MGLGGLTFHHPAPNYTYSEIRLMTRNSDSRAFVAAAFSAPPPWLAQPGLSPLQTCLRPVMWVYIGCIKGVYRAFKGV